MLFSALNILRNKGINISTLLLTFLLVMSCNNDDSILENEIEVNVIETIELPQRTGSRPETTKGVPHIQIGVELVSEVHAELIRRVYAVPGIKNRPSVVAGWQGLWISNEVTVVAPESLIAGREFAHIHDDGSLHIFLEPTRSEEAVETCWAVFHPFAVERLAGWDGFVMLYTPQSMDELNVTFQLIIDGYNYITGQNLLATDYY